MWKKAGDQNRGDSGGCVPCHWTRTESPYNYWRRQQQPQQPRRRPNLHSDSDTTRHVRSFKRELPYPQFQRNLTPPSSPRNQTASSFAQARRIPGCPLHRTRTLCWCSIRFPRRITTKRYAARSTTQAQRARSRATRSGELPPGAAPACGAPWRAASIGIFLMKGAIMSAEGRGTRGAGEWRSSRKDTVVKSEESLGAAQKTLMRVKPGTRALPPFVGSSRAGRRERTEAERRDREQ